MDSAPFYPRHAAWYTYGMSMEKPPGGINTGSTTGSVEVRQTPNPNARKFILAGKHFGASRNYALGDTVDESPAAQLLALQGVYNVLLAQDFVTVNKLPDVEWPPLQAAVEQILNDYLSQNVSNNAG